MNGWTYDDKKKKWHYMENGESLCGKFRSRVIDTGEKNESNADCKDCILKKKEQAG